MSSSPQFQVRTTISVYLWPRIQVYSCYIYLLYSYLQRLTRSFYFWNINNFYLSNGGFGQDKSIKLLLCNLITISRLSFLKRYQTNAYSYSKWWPKYNFGFMMTIAYLSKIFAWLNVNIHNNPRWLTDLWCLWPIYFENYKRHLK